MTAHPKPKPRRREPVRVYPDGREVCDRMTKEGRKIYRFRTLEMRSRQGNRCPLCPYLLFEMDATFDHQEGRGMDGSTRDDRIECEGEWINAAVHYSCNGRKGSRRFHWVDGRYVPVLEER